MNALISFLNKKIKLKQGLNIKEPKTINHLALSKFNDNFFPIIILFFCSDNNQDSCFDT